MDQHDIALIPLVKKALNAPEKLFARNLNNPRFATLATWAHLIVRDQRLADEHRSLINEFLDRIRDTLHQEIDSWLIKKDMWKLTKDLTPGRRGGTGSTHASAPATTRSSRARSTATRPSSAPSSNPSGGTSAESSAAPTESTPPGGPSSSSTACSTSWQASPRTPTTTSSSSLAVPMPPKSIARSRGREGHWSDCEFRRDPERLCNCAELDHMP